MRRFADLYDAVDRTTSVQDKTVEIAAYLRSVPAEDAAWGVYLLMGRRVRRTVKRGELIGVAGRLSGLARWLLDESLSSVGDLAEGVALVLDTAGVLDKEGSWASLREWIEDRIEPLGLLDGPERADRLAAWWMKMERREVFLMVKILTGAMRVGVSAGAVSRAVSMAAGIAPEVAARRLMGDWRPSGAFFARLMAADEGESGAEREGPYPFFLASPVETGGDGEPEPVLLAKRLGDIAGYQCEWKWDGIRCQVRRGGGRVSIWTRGGELVTDRFPEVVEAVSRVRDGGAAGHVLDGEILAWRDGSPLAFGRLQRRIARTGLTGRVLAESPVVFVAYDLLERAGVDIRGSPLRDRRSMLEGVVSSGLDGRLMVSPLVAASSWEELVTRRAESRGRGVEGVMIKRLDDPYGVGRRRGSWWKWKIDPYSIDAVLVQARPGRGRRASLLTDYTFAVREGAGFVAVASAYSGLSDEEIRRVDAWCRSHTVERHGPVWVVEPLLVFELHFEGIAVSSRHRGGVAVRFPRIARWRMDKAASEVDTLDSMRSLLVAENRPREASIFDGLDVRLRGPFGGPSGV